MFLLDHVDRLAVNGMHDWPQRRVGGDDESRCEETVERETLTRDEPDRGRAPQSCGRVKPSDVETFLEDDARPEKADAGDDLRRDPRCAPIIQDNARVRDEDRRAERNQALSDQFFGLSLAVVASAMSNPFRYFNNSPEIIRLAVLMYVKYPLSLRNVEDLLAERGIDISHETVRFWWNRFGPMFAAEIRKRRVAHMRGYPQWRWHLDEAFVKVNGKLCYLWRAVDHEGEVLEAVVTAKRDKAAALKFLKRIMKKYCRPLSVVTDGLCSYPAAMKEIGNADRQEAGRRLNNRAENSHQPFRRRERAMQRFRSMKTLQKFSSVHAQVHNHFNQERHLVTRQVYKQRRSAALAEWSALAA